MLATILSSALALAAFDLQVGTYREAMERGIAALEAGQGAVAAGHFRTAGELAPQAPTWRVYLAHALGQQAVARAPAPPGVGMGGGWVSVDETSAGLDALRFDSTGERLLSGRDPAVLWDARTGECISVLARQCDNPGDDPGGTWQFDATGRFVVGLGPESTPLADLDLRDARTGDPVAAKLEAELELSRASVFEWVPANEPPPRVQLGQVVDIRIGHGLLRCRSVPLELDEQLILRPDHRRALIVRESEPPTLRLVDAVESRTMAHLAPAGTRAWFSRDDALAAVTDGAELWLFDAEAGRRLRGPALPEFPADGDWDATFDGGLVVLLNRAGEAVWWDPRANEEDHRVLLEPPPPAGICRVAVVDEGHGLLVRVAGSIQRHSAETGVLEWSIDAAGSELVLSPDGSHLAFPDPDGRPRCVDVRTGVAYERTPVRNALWTVAVEPLACDKACIVVAADGSLRRVDLATGKTTVTADEHRGRGTVALRTIGTDRIASWVEGGQFCLRGAETLYPLNTIDLGRGSTLLAISGDGGLVILRDAEELLEVRDVTGATEPRRIRAGLQFPRCAAFSPDGSKWAAVYEGHAKIYSAKSMAPLGTIALRNAKQPGPAVFHGNELLAIGWGNRGNRGRVGVDVLNVDNARRVARLRPADWPAFGGYINDLRSDTEDGCLVFSWSPWGAVAAFSDEGWHQRWNLDYGGGQATALALRSASSSGRVYISGMGIVDARAVAIGTGETLSSKPVEACFALTGTSDDRFAIGIRDSALVVFDGRKFERLYTRREGPNAASWLEEAQPPSGAIAAASGPGHLCLDGVSRPRDCWDPWLFDPLGLAPEIVQATDALPLPPRIVDGPPRVVVTDADSVELEFTATGPGLLFGIQVTTTGRPTRFAPTDDDGLARITIHGPWPTEIRARAVTQSGVRSAPWRVAVEGNTASVRQPR